MIEAFKSKIFNSIYLLLRFGNYMSSNSDVSIASSAKVYGSRLDGSIEIGEGCLVARCEIHGAVKIGRYSSINGPNTDIMAEDGKVNIGQFCSIARGVAMQVSNHNMNRPTTYPIFKNIFREQNKEEFVSKGDIVIENDVWIGAHAIILSGAKIGNGAVVAANSVVNGEVPPYAIVAGSPAKIIKYRFSPETIDYLLHTQWWGWPIEKIKSEKIFFERNLKVE